MTTGRSAGGLPPYRVVSAVLVTVLVLALQWLVWPVFRPFVGALSYPALFLAVWIGGLWGGLLSTVTAAVAILYVFLPPEMSWGVETPRNLTAVLVFCTLGVLISLTDHRLRVARNQVVEQARAVAQDQFKVIFDLAPVGITVADEGGTFIAANSTVCRLFGYDASAIVGKSYWDLFAPEEQARVREIADQVDALGSHKSDVRCLRADGTAFTAEVVTIRLADGRAQSIIRDVEGEREQQWLLQESERKYAALTETSPDLIFTIGNDDRVSFVNASAAQALHRAPDDVVGCELVELFGQATASYMLKSIYEVRASGEIISVENDAPYPDGVKAMHTTLVPLKDASGRVGSVYGIARDITHQREVQASLSETTHKLKSALRSMISTLGKTVEVRDPYTQGHQDGVAHFGRLIASEMGMSEEDVHRVGTASLLHDVGNLSIPAEILTKPGPLTDAEFALVQRHSQAGRDILAEVDLGWPLAEIVYQTHERLDGSGYPRGLQGEEIHPMARVIMVADVLEAMTAHRPYRPALDLSEALEELTGHPGKYDPDVVAVVVRLAEARRLER